MKDKTLAIRMFLLLTFLLNTYLANAATLEVGPNKTFASPALAAQQAQPGDTILIFPSTYTGSNFISNLNGNSNAYIHFIGTNPETVIFQGGSQGMHFSQVSYIHIEGLSFTQHTGNGLNIDDGGTFSTPTHHIKIINCRFYDMGAQGNNDFLKMSGVDDFEVSGCTFQNGANGGSGIDMVGCHQGKILRCTFNDLGSNCIQAKGGTQFIDIAQNWFEDGGQRALNLGGSTGLEFFRPQDAPFEAADLNVYANVFVGGWAPIAYVGCVRVHVVNNTIISPQNWVMRILQETINPARFLPCGDNSFINNIVYFNNSLSTFVNIGSNTDPGSFEFSNNLWYNFASPANSTPNLPASESNSIVGQDPSFINVGNADYQLRSGSPAINTGIMTNFMIDFNGVSLPQGGLFDIGAFENGSILANSEEKGHVALHIFPNPTTSMVTIKGLLNKTDQIFVTDIDGKVMNENIRITNTGTKEGCTINLERLSSGIYFIGNHQFVAKVVKF